jgi:hypothetical protein
MDKASTEIFNSYQSHQFKTSKGCYNFYLFISSLSHNLQDICVRLAKFRKINPDSNAVDKREIPTIVMNKYFKEIDTNWSKQTEGFTEGIFIIISNLILIN